MKSTKNNIFNSPAEGNAFTGAMAKTGGDYDKAKALLGDSPMDYGTGSPFQLRKEKLSGAERRNQKEGIDTSTPENKKRFQEYWCKKFEPAFNWDKFQKDSNKATQERFVEHHKKNFIHNTDYKRPDCKLCYFNKDDMLWEHDPKSGIGKGRIHNLLRTEDYYYWKTILEKALDKIEDKESESYLFKEGFTNKYLAHYFSTGNWISGTVKNIYNTLLYNPNLKKEIQFNLMEKTKHYRFKL